MDFRKVSIHLISNWFRSSCLQIFNKIGFIKNFTGKHLCWSHFSLWKDSSTDIFLWILCNFPRNIIYRTPPDDCSCWFLHSNQGFIHWSHPVCFFLYFCPFLIDNWKLWEFVQKVYKNEDFFTFCSSLSKC